VLLTIQKDTEGARILKDLGVQRFMETTGSDFRPVSAYARAFGLNPRTEKMPI
jgi:hypothetical protein